VKAVVFDSFGGPEVLRYDEVPDPVPGAGDVVVDVEFAALNHVDIDVREGLSRFDFALPHILGIEGAGVVSELGPGVVGLSVGDRVAVSYVRTCGRCEWCARGQDNLCENRKLFGEHIPGSYAQRMVAPASHCLPLPDSLSTADAAASLVAFGTAWHALVPRGGLRVGETVLIHSIGSGVASAALQICKAAGATVIGTASSDEKLARATADGADHVINYRSTTDLWAAVLDATAGRGVDLVFDVVGGDAFTGSMSVMRPYARLISIGAHAGEVVPFDIIEFFRRHISYISSHTQTRDELAHVLRLIAAGTFSPRIHSVHPLADAAVAQEELAERSNYGKILLDVTG
jgi:NADPH:quinone reductase-like Zn-dependent oxidoreductase